MKKPRSWRLSRRLLWSFVLLAVVPLLVVGLGIRQYTRAMLDQSFSQRAGLTRQLVSGWTDQLKARTVEALALVRVDSKLQTLLSAPVLDRDGLLDRLQTIAVRSGVDGIDLFEHHGGGMLLVARTGEPMHVGFPVQAPFDTSVMIEWRAPELGVRLYGMTTMLPTSRRLLAAAYVRLNQDLLHEIGKTSSFVLACRGVDGEVITVGGGPLETWPPVEGLTIELLELELGGKTFALGSVYPFLYGLPLTERIRALHRLDLFLGVAIFLAASVAVFTAWRVTSAAARPIEELAAAVGQWKGGVEFEPLITFAEGETATLADAFELLRHELSAAEKRLTAAARAAGWQEMARKVAHEIKNPLTPIRITMEDLARHVERDPEKAIAMIPEAARLVGEEVAVMGRIVDAFARFARLPEPQPVVTDLVAVVRDTVALYQSDTQATTTIDAVSQNISAVIDPQLFREALANLIKNAQEASGPEGRVLVHVSRHLRRAMVMISDSGNGFPEEFLKDGLRPYFTTKADGTGLGLIVSQRIITDMGGELKLLNTNDGGQVQVSFPVKS